MALPSQDAGAGGFWVGDLAMLRNVATPRPRSEGSFAGAEAFATTRQSSAGEFECLCGEFISNCGPAARDRGPDPFPTTLNLTQYTLCYDVNLNHMCIDQLLGLQKIHQ